MAAAIGVPFERYKKYETRSPMPAYLIPRFAQIVDRSMSYILTGRDEVITKPSVRRLVRTGTDYFTYIQIIATRISDLKICGQS